MRLFELLVILIGTVFFLDSILVKTSKRVVLYVYIVLSGVLTLLHLVLEKGRWPMIPAYLMICFLMIRSVKLLIKPVQRKKKSKLTSRIAVTILALIYSFFTFISPFMVPVFSFPNPKSNYIVGSTARQLTDVSRKDLPFGNSNRELMIQVWYPAEKTKGLERMKYYPYKGMSKAFAEMLNYPGFFFNSIDLVKTNSFLGAKSLTSRTPYPVILLSHGYRDTRFDYTFLTEELVRKGYIVVGIDHPHYTSSTVFPDNRIIKPDVSESDILNNPDTNINIWIQDAEFVISQLGSINQNDKLLKGMFDMDRLGYIGHSFGGATALKTAIRDKKIKAVVNMDGWVPSNSNDLLDFPIMVMTHDPKADNAKQGTGEYNRFKDTRDSTANTYRNAGKAAYIVQLKNTMHMSFSDISMLTRVFQLNLTSPKKCFNIINDYTDSFFDKYLKGKDNGLLSRKETKYPEVTLKYNKK